MMMSAHINNFEKSHIASLEVFLSYSIDSFSTITLCIELQIRSKGLSLWNRHIQYSNLTREQRLKSRTRRSMSIGSDALFDT